MSVFLKLVLFVAVAQTSAQRYMVEGSVVFDSAFMSEPVLVRLEGLNSRLFDQLYVNVSGNFKFRYLPAGTYYVRVIHKSFEEVSQRVEVPGLSEGLVIFLQPKLNTPQLQEAPLLGGKHKVDLRQLSIPEDAAREYRKALDDDKKGKTSRVIQRLKRALSIAPNFIEASFHLGSALYKIGHFEEAEKALMRALKTAPKEPHLRLMLANVFVKEEKYEQALSQIDAYLEENPDGSERGSAELIRSQLIRAMEK